MHTSQVPAARAERGASSLPFGPADYADFEQGVQARFGIRLREYRSDQMLRRLKTLAQSHKYTSFANMLQAIKTTPAALDSFLDTMTINVTELLRNPDRFAELMGTMLPDLLARAAKRPLQVWSAGCSYGAEAYTVAMLLHEADPTGTHRIKGTDIDLAILAKANAICFSEQDMAQVSLPRRQAHFTDIAGDLPGRGPLDPRYRPQTHLRGKIQFGRHDLLADPYPPAEYDLILCRNVLIYFTEEAKNRIYQGFCQALRPGGILFVGGTERISDHRAAGFELLRPFFYRKPLGP